MSELDYRVVRGNPTPQELAAVTAVLAAAIEEEAAAAELALDQQPSAWALTQRPLRHALDRSAGWRSFP